jgi:hypothetical protein
LIGEILLDAAARVNGDDSMIARNPELWAIVGVIVGFLLGEVSRLLRHMARIRSLRKMIREELKSIQAQVPQKVDLIAKVQDSLSRDRLLPGESVAILSLGWRQHGPELYSHLEPKQRNCLHVIHERLRVADEFLAGFETYHRHALAEGVITDPKQACRDRLADLTDSYSVVSTLISGYLSGRPQDVFNTELSEEERSKVRYE